ncbi:MAG: GNAT family N-acetyltransferase [Methylorubrum rhodinum]|uniref:GNAT family N-acetyltransferase n=1 Tax=Methylorubrum rhodinum TaxID=29428 RepID=UPI003BAFA9EF
MFARIPTADERDVVVDLCVAAVEESVREIAPERALIEATYQEYLDTANPTFFVVEDRREIVAFLLCSLSTYRFAPGVYATQEVIYVRPDRRGTRAAALLVQELCAWSDRLGAREITGGNDNGLFSEQTAKLLGRFGFERVGLFMRRPGGVRHG